MARTNTKILYDEFKVEDGGIVYDMDDLQRLSEIFDRLSTAQYLLENVDEVDDARYAYDMAEVIREKADDMCTCESEAITTWYSEAKDYADHLKQAREQE